MTRLAWTSLLLAALLAPAVCAQSGPAPGTDPLGYAVAHAQGEAAAAQADPAGYAQGKATQQALENETAEALYIACWQAYDVLGDAVAETCAPWFTAPKDLGAPHGENATGNATLEEVAPLIDNATLLANATAAAVEQVVADPASAPSVVEQLAGAVVGFAGAVVDFLLGLVGSVVDGLGLGLDAVVGLLLGIADAIVDGLGLGIAASVDVLGALGGLLGSAAGGLADGLVALATGLADGIVALGTGIVVGFRLAATGTADAVAFVAGTLADAFTFLGLLALDGVAALADGIVAVASGTVGLAASGADAVVDGVAAAASGIADAVDAVADTVASWFSGSGESSQARPEGKGALPTVPKEADGLVGRVRDAVPL